MKSKKNDSKYLLISQGTIFLRKTSGKYRKISLETLEVATIKKKNIRIGVLLDFPSEFSPGGHQTQRSYKNTPLLSESSVPLN